MKPKPDDLWDRERDWATLAKLWAKKGPDLAFVVGRRRVGKSYVLARFCDAVGGIYYQATRRTEAEQLAVLTRLIGSRFDDAALAAGATFGSWETLLDYLTQKAGKDPCLLVIDEFPYLTESAPAFTSILQSYWDHQWKRTRLKCVLSGSYITAMHQLEQGDQPLFGRRTAKVACHPFGYQDIGHFVPSYDAVDRALTYGVFGNLPGNLALLDPEEPFLRNVADLLLDTTSRLVDDAQHILDAFVPDPTVHYSILQAIALGDRTWQGITGRVGKTGGSILRPLQWLEEMEVIQRVVPITEKDPRKSKRVVYRITDPYVEFWHRVVGPLWQAGALGLRDPMELAVKHVEPQLNDHMGPVFEQLCRDFVAAEGADFAPMRVGEWWDRSSTNQVDIVALGAKKELFVAECKWGAVKGSDLEKLRERAALLSVELGGVSSTRYALFAARGEADKDVRAAVKRGEASLYDLESLS